MTKNLFTFIILLLSTLLTADNSLSSSLSSADSLRHATALKSEAELLQASDDNSMRALHLYRKSLALYPLPGVAWHIKRLEGWQKKLHERQKSQEEIAAETNSQKNFRHNQLELSQNQLSLVNGVYRPADFGVLIEKFLFRYGIRNLPIETVLIQMLNFDSYRVLFMGASPFADRLSLLFSPVDTSTLQIQIKLAPGRGVWRDRSGDIFTAESAEIVLQWSELKLIRKVKARIEKPALLRKGKRWQAEEMDFELHSGGVEMLCGTVTVNGTEKAEFCFPDKQ